MSYWGNYYPPPQPLYRQSPPPPPASYYPPAPTYTGQAFRPQLHGAYQGGGGSLYRPPAPPPTAATGQSKSQHRHRSKSRQGPGRQPAIVRLDNRQIQRLFESIDLDKNGAIDAAELQTALSNGTRSAFNPLTVCIMIGLFDKTGDGTINAQEFVQLWQYVQSLVGMLFEEWVTTFARFDKNSSGTIDRDELKQCTNAFGYKLTDGFHGVLMSRFDRTRRGKMNFDDFVQLCVHLQTLTDVFRQKDVKRTGRITVTYEQFILMMTEVMLKMMSGGSRR